MFNENKVLPVYSLFILIFYFCRHCELIRVTSFLVFAAVLVRHNCLLFVWVSGPFPFLRISHCLKFSNRIFPELKMSVSRLFTIIGDSNVRRNMTGLNVASREAMKKAHHRLQRGHPFCLCVERRQEGHQRLHHRGSD